MYNMLDTFEKYNLSISAEQVLDIVWKMSMPLLHTIIDSMRGGGALGAYQAGVFKSLYEKMKRNQNNDLYSF
jgi:hypothetical protein